MTTMGVVFAVINLIAVVLLIFKFRGTTTESASASGDLPGWASDQMKELKDTLENKDSELEQTKASLTALQVQTAQQISSLEANLKAAEEKLEDQLKNFEEQKAQAKADKEVMANEFKVLAEKVLEEKSKQFKTTNSEELDKLLAPFKQKLVDFEATVKENHKEELKNTSALMENIKALKNMNDQL
ncbi:MAG: hypothetical protein PVJ94_03870, partial [Flavobacteriales bacterium]